jgi:hypothetical protein
MNFRFCGVDRLSRNSSCAANTMATTGDTLEIHNCFTHAGNRTPPRRSPTRPPVFDGFEADRKRGALRDAGARAGAASCTSSGCARATSDMSCPTAQNA